jgi:hypothetical protein
MMTSYDAIRSSPATSDESSPSTIVGKLNKCEPLDEPLSKVLQYLRVSNTGRVARAARPFFCRCPGQGKKISDPR